MKLFYRVKGKYKDGRNRIAIEDRDKGTSKLIPKPEELQHILSLWKAVFGIKEYDTLKTTKSTKGKVTP